MKLLVTGGAGFIGSNFVRWMLESRPDVSITVLDKLTYAGNPENLKGLDGPRFKLIQGDVADPAAVERAMAGCDAAVHFAAETHVDRSIQNAADFLRTNIQGTHTLLERARISGLKKFVHISTDEVYGSLEEGEADEQGALRPNSPYAASKAGSDHLVRAYHVTYGVPAAVVRGSNNFGPRQFPEKFLPLLITNAIDDDPLPIYGDGKYVREWIYVLDFCEGIGVVLDKGKPGEIYNIGSADRRVNLDVVRRILEKMGKPASLVRHVTDRLGHDRRYAISSAKLRGLGWAPRRNFDAALDETIAWYRANESWWRPLKKKAAAKV